MPAPAKHRFHPPRRRALSVLIRLSVAAAVALQLMAMPMATSAAAPEKNHPAINAHHGQPDVDVRTSLKANIKETAAQRNEVKALRATARWNERTGTVGSLTRFGGYLTPKSRLGAVAIGRAFLAAHPGLFGLSRADVGAMLVTSSYVTKHNGVTQLTLQQTSAGLPVYGASVTFAIDGSGRILTVGSRAVPSRGAQAAPRIDAADAVAASAAAVGANPAALTVVSRDGAAGHKTIFKNGIATGVKSPRDITADLVVFPMVGGRAARLGWRTVVEVSDVGWYESIVDSATSAVLYRQNYYHDAGPEGQVWTGENPTIGTQHIVSFAGDPAFDNAGWVGGTTTSGNNVNAYQDLTNSNSVGFQPTSATQQFSYPFTNAYGTAPNTDVTTDQSAVVTQLFYYTNFMHDYLYRLGFDEASRNFQNNNFGRGGSGGDAVNAEADDGFNFGCTSSPPPVPIRCLNNANFGTPGDGSAPRMQMYLWTSPFVDGDMDGGIIAHEYGHGLSSRLVGGGSLGGGTQTGALGEGNSDFWADSIYNTPIVGVYVTGNTVTGIRRVAYNNSPWTYASLCNAGCEVHNDGEIWASALWDLRQSLINHSTFAAGKATAEQLVIDGLKNTVTTPTFLDARDGILAADVADNAGANQCLIWSVFSLRGMGVSASSSGDQNTVTAGFDLPPECYPDVQITKSGSPNPVIAGNELIYSLNVTNAGPVTATNVSVVDTIPAGTSFVTSTIACVEAPVRTLTCPIGTMQDGTSKGFQIKVLVSPAIDLGGGPTSITNSATVSQTQPDGQPLNNTATAATIVNESSDLQVAKTCDATVLAGQSGSCTIYVDNNGPSAARNVKLTDVASSDGMFTMTSASPSQGSPCVISPTTPTTSATATCNLGDLGATTISGPGRATVVVSYTALEGQRITDQATATSPTPDPASGNNTASASLPITAVADLEITADTATPVTPSAGTALTFSVTVRNNGPSTARTVVLKDALPAGITINNVSLPGASSCNVGVPGDPLQPVTCGFDLLASGASKTMTITTTIKPQTQGLLHSDAAASSATFDPNNSNNFAHTDTTVAVVADLALAMSASPNPVIAGRSLTWTAVVSNGGPSTARGVTLDETLPAGVTFGTANISNGAIGTCAQVVGQPNHIACQLNELDPGASATVLTQVTVDAATAKNTVLTATGVAATTSTDPVPANNSTSASSTVDTLADLAVTLTAPSHVYSPSTTVTYTAGVVNGGPSDAQAVVLRVNLPGTKIGHYVSNNAPAGVCAVTTSTAASIVVTCNLNALAAAASRSIQVVYFIQGNQKIQTSTDTVTSTTADPVAANNTASWTVGPK